MVGSSGEAGSQTQSRRGARRRKAYASPFCTALRLTSMLRLVEAKKPGRPPKSRSADAMSDEDSSSSSSSSNSSNGGKPAKKKKKVASSSSSSSSSSAAAARENGSENEPIEIDMTPSPSEESSAPPAAAVKPIGKVNAVKAAAAKSKASTKAGGASGAGAGAGAGKQKPAAR